MLTILRNARQEPGVKRVIGHRLDVLAEIEGNSKASRGMFPKAGMVASLSSHGSDPGGHAHATR